MTFPSEVVYRHRPVGVWSHFIKGLPETPAEVNEEGVFSLMSRLEYLHLTGSVKKFMFLYNIRTSFETTNVRRSSSRTKIKGKILWRSN